MGWRTRADRCPATLRPSLIEHASLSHCGTQHAADLVSSPFDLVKIGGDEIHGDWDVYRRFAQSDRHGVLVIDLRQHHQQVDIAVAMLLAGRDRPEQDDLKRIELVANRRDEIGQPLAQRPPVVSTVVKLATLSALFDDRRHRALPN